MQERIKVINWLEHGQNFAQFLRDGLMEIKATQDEVTEKALRFSIGDNQYWFPKSLISTLVDPDGKCHYYAPSWMVKQKGLL